MYQSSMTRRAFIAAVIVVCASPGLSGAKLEDNIRALAESLAKDMRGRATKKVAALDFRDIRGYKSALDPFIAEELTTQIMLVAPGEFTFIERRHLDRLISEQKLTSSAFFDRTSLAEMGKMLGVHAIVTGTISDLGTEIKINARAIAVQTGEVFSAASTSVAKEGAVAELLRQTAGPSTDAPFAPRVMERNSNLSDPHVQASDVFFDNHLVRITVSGASLSPDRKRLTLSLVIENVGAAELPIGLPHTDSTGHCAVTVSDNRGNLLRARNFDIAGLPCVYGIHADKADAYAVIIPRSRSTLVVQFSSRDGIGNVLALGLELQTLSGGKARRFSAGIPNIQAR